MKYLLVGIVFIAFNASLSFAGIYEELTPREKKLFDSGKQAVRTIDVDGSAWPKIYVFQRMDATAEEVAAVFADYSIHKELVARLTKSEVQQQIDPLTAIVAYTMSLGGIPGGILPDENYTTLNHLRSYDNGQSYSLDWTKKSSDHIPFIEGLFRVEPLGTGSIVSYYNFIIPHEPTLASFITRLAVNQVKDTVAGLGRRAVHERINDQAQLQRQVTSLREALKFQK